MATEADIPAPICETRMEQGGDVVDQATNISINKLPEEKKNQADNIPNEPPTVEGEIFLTPPSIEDVHCEVTSISLDASKVTEEPDQTVQDDTEILLLKKLKLDDQSSAIAANEETSSKSTQQNAEESNASNKENLQETNLLSEENEKSKVAESPDDQTKTASAEEGFGDKRNSAENSNTAADKDSQENSTFMETITDETCKGDKIQSKSDSDSSLHKEDSIPMYEGDKAVTTPEDSGVVSEHTVIENQGDVANLSKTLEDIANTHGNSELTEKIEESSLIQVDDSQIKCDKQLGKESEKLPSIEVSTRGINDNEFAIIDTVTTLQDSGDLLENTVNENQEDVANQCTNLEDTATIQGNPDVKEKTEESSLIQVDGLQMKCDKQLESEKLPSTEISTVSTNDNESAVIDTVIISEDSRVLLEHTVNENQGDVANPSETLEDIATTLDNPEVTEKIEESSLIQVDGLQMECDKQLEKESEKLPSIEVSTADTNDNESAVIEKVKDEDEDLIKVELSENERSTSTLLDEVQVEKPVEYLYVAPENLDQVPKTTNSLEEQSTDANLQRITSEETEKKTIDEVDTQKEVLESFSSSTEEGSINANLQGVTTDSMDEKTIDEVIDTEKEVLENFPTLVSNEEIEENLMIKVDSSEVKIAEHLENESEKKSSPLPLETEAGVDEPMVMHEAHIEESKLRKAETSENEESTESMLVKIESKIEKPDDSYHVASEDIKASDLGQEREISSFKEQCLTAHPQGILDEETDDKKVDAAETKEESLDIQNVAATVSNEKTEENSLIQVDGSQMKDEEHLKESENPSLIEDLTWTANQDELTVMDEIKIEDENPSGEELEKNIDGALKEVHIEKPEESFYATLEDIKASDLDQHTETTGFLEEQSITENPQGVLGDKTEEKTIDAADTNEETNDDELKKMHEPKDRDEDLIKPELLENEIYTASTSVKEEAQVEKPTDSLQVPTEDIKASDSNQETNLSSIEEQILTADPQETSGDKIEEKTIDAADTKEEILEDIATDVPNGDDEDNSTVEEYGSQKPSFTEASTGNANNDVSTIMHEANFVVESSIKADLFMNERNAGDTSVKEEISTESLQVIAGDSKAFALVHDRETSSLEEQSLTANPQGIIGDHKEDKANDATGVKQETPDVKNVATTMPYEDMGQNSLIQVDCSQMEQKEYLGKESENESFTTSQTAERTEKTLVKEEACVEKLIDSFQEASEDNKASDQGQERSPIQEQIQLADPQEISGEETIYPSDLKEEIHNDKNVATTILIAQENTEQNSLIQVDCSQMEYEEQWEKKTENPSSTKAMIVKEEAQMEKPIDFLQVPCEDIRGSASSQDMEISSIKEQMLTEDSQEISGEKTEEAIDATDKKEETREVQDIATNVLDGDNEDNSPIEVGGSQKTSLKEASTGNVNDNEPAIVHEDKFVDESLINTELFENEKKTEQDTEDIKPSALNQDTEISSPEEQGVASNSQGIMNDNKEDKTIDPSDTEEETHKDKNVATIIPTPKEDTEENSLVQVDCSQMEYEEHLETETENPSSPKAPTVKEEAQMENSIDSLQVDTEVIKASASSQDIEISSIKEQIPTEDSQEISGHKIKETTIDATDTNEETLEIQDIVTNVLNGDNEDNSPIEVDGSQKPCLEEASTRVNDNESTIMHENKFVDESLINTELFENEKNTEGTLIKEEVSIESLQVTTEDIKSNTSDQDRETRSLEEQSLTPNPQGIMNENKEDKTIDPSNTKEETHADENIATSVPAPQEDTEENSVIQVDCSQMEYEEHLEKETENPSSPTAPAVKEEAHMENPIDSLQVATEDIKASASSQGTEKSSIEEQFITKNSQEISIDKTEEKTSYATGMNQETTLEDQDTTTNVLNGDNEDNSPTEVDGSQNLSLMEPSTGNTNDNESTVLYEDKFVDESLTNTDLFENEKNTEGTLVQEEVSIESPQVAIEDIKASASNQDRETSSLQERSLTINAQGIMDDNKEDKTIDPSDLKEDSLKDKNVATTILIPEEDTVQNSQIQVDCSQMEYEEHLENESQNPSSTKAPIMKEEAQVENPIDSLQVATEDIKPSAPSQNIEMISIKEQILTQDSQETSWDKTEEKTIDAAYMNEKTLEVQDIAPNLPGKDSEDYSPTEVDGLQKPSLKEASSRNANNNESTTMHEAKFVDESLIKAGLSENEKNAVAGTLVKEKVFIESLQVAAQDIKAYASSQDTEPSSLEEQSLNTNPQGIIGDNKEEKTINPSDPKEEAHNDENVTITSDEGIQENSLIQVCSRTQHEEHLEKEIENPSITETLKGDADHESTNFVALEEVASEQVLSSNVASEEVSKSNVLQESTIETQPETENVEAQKQDENLVSALTKHSSIGKTEKDVELCLASAHDSEITQEMQKLEEASQSSPHEKIIENITEEKNQMESEVVEDATKDKYIEHLDQDDTTESFLVDKKPTENEQEETECRQEKLMSGETEGKIEGSSSVPIVNEFLPKSLKETSEVDHFTAAQLTTDATESTVINNNTSLKDILSNRGSIWDLETKIDVEAPEVIETTPTSTEGQEIGSTNVGETSDLISQCERDDYEPASIGSVLEEKSDPNVVEFEHGYESKSQVLESIAQVQSCDIISKAEENEENLEAAAEIKSEAEDRFEPKETMKDEISSEKIKEEDKDVEDFHLGSYKEKVITENRLEDEVKQEEEMNREEIFEVIKNANETEKVSSEASDKDLVEPEENLLANESIDRSLHQKEQGERVEEFTTILDTKEADGLDHAYRKTETEDSREEVNRSTEAFLEDEDNRKGGDGVDNEIMKDEGLLNQNSNTSVLDAATEELPKRLDENIICEAAPTKTDHTTIEDCEGKTENANTIMMQQQEEDNKIKHESLPFLEYQEGRASEKQMQMDEICSSDEVQAKDEGNLMLLSGKSDEKAHKGDMWSTPTEDEDRNTYFEAEKLDFSHTKDTSEVSPRDVPQDTPENNANSTIKDEFSEDKYSNESTESQIYTVSKDIGLIGQTSEATRITDEVQEPKAGSSSGSVPEATGVHSRQLEEASDTCKGVAENSTSTEPTNISTSKIMQEYTVGTSSEAEDQLTKLHGLPQESHVRGSEMKMAEKDGPVDLRRAIYISEELNEVSVEVPNKENQVKADPNENIKASISSEGQEAKAIPKAPVSETLKQEIEESAVPEAKGMTCEEEKIIDDECKDLIENSCSQATEMVSESIIHHGSMEDTSQRDKNDISQKQIDSLPILPHTKCSDIETAKKDLPIHSAGLDGTGVKELEVTPLPAKDKNVGLEADHTMKVNPENSIDNKNISVIQHGGSAECSPGEGEILKPSNLEQEEAKSGHEERKSQETTRAMESSESKETDKLSLLDLLRVSVKETSQMVDHSATDKEPTMHREDLQAEKTDEAEHEDAKTDEEKDDEEESGEQRTSELGSEAPVMVDAADADVKVAHKKSHNLLSGVGSKVKHSIAKVKKAITGKSSHPKPPSPKQGDKIQKTAVS